MAFKPKYTIIEKILNNLTAIASAREVIDRSHLAPELEALLRNQARIRSAHSSTAISGNKLTLKEVEALAYGKDISTGAVHSVKEIKDTISKQGSKAKNTLR